jgi:hypothetical protein
VREKGNARLLHLPPGESVFPSFRGGAGGLDRPLQPWIGFPVGYAVSGILLTVFGYFAMILAQ